jgi:hypothetical protein
MRATRLTQPYRRGSRSPGLALSNMTRGRSAYGANPQDLTRAVQRLMRAGKAGKRPARPVRPDRPPRP